MRCSRPSQNPTRPSGELIERANEGGGPDNITCIVADLVEGDAPADDTPVVVGPPHPSP